jgi:hypothetical protein
MIEGEARVYGNVDMEILFSDKQAEPAPDVYGDIARTYFYMRDRYGLEISNSQEKMLIAWNNLDPVSDWEKKRNTLIKELQGDDNRYVSDYKKMEQLGGTNEALATDFEGVQKELSEKYAFILEKLSPTVGGILLFIMTLFVLYRRKNQHKSQEVIQEKTTTSKRFMFLSKLGNVAISFNAHDEVIIEEANENNPKQHWVLTKANQQKPYFFIENVDSGKVIEVEKGDSNDGANIVMNKKRKTKNDHQEWHFESADDAGYVFVVSKGLLNVLDIKDKKTAHGTQLQSFHKKMRGTENQEWEVKRV